MTDPGIAVVGWSDERRADLAKTLSLHLTLAQTMWLVEAVAGRQGLKALANSVDDPDKYATGAVELFHKRGVIDTAVVRLMREASANRPLIADLTYVQNGERLSDAENHQAFRSGFDRFLDASDSEWLISRMTGSVCAIAIGDTIEDVKGTGFLVGPDLVITNWHVIQWVAEMENGKPVQKTTGDQIFCIFDHEEELLPKPPLTGYKAGIVVRGAQPTWLVHGRLSLKNDGSDEAEPMVDQLDYAVIKLETPIGKARRRPGGGPRRGWLSLPPAELNYFGTRELLLFQHPGQLRLKWDKGPIVQLNPADSTRVWYEIWSAKGSSGGAAVDPRGRVYAIHNASVTRSTAPKPPARPWNQGVRIDRIAEDIRKAAPDYFVTEPGWGTTSEHPTSSMMTTTGSNAIPPAAAPRPTPPAAMPVQPATPPPAPDPTLADLTDYWSLTDHRYDPKPILGRKELRKQVLLMSAAGGKRVLLVTGPAYSGVRFSVKLLHRVLPHAATALFEPKRLESKPEDFALSLARQLGLVDLGTDPLPAPGVNETITHWVSGRLSDWIMRRVRATAQRVPGQFPAWVIINCVVPPNQGLQVNSDTRDLIAELIGAADGPATARNIPELRWLFLGSILDGVRVPAEQRVEDSLAGDPKYDEELRECLTLAWDALSIDEQVPPTMAKIITQYAIDQRPNDPRRKVLADKIRELVLDKIQ
jgi:hypothetical protein